MLRNFAVKYEWMLSCISCLKKFVSVVVGPGAVDCFAKGLARCAPLSLHRQLICRAKTLKVSSLRHLIVR